MLGLAAAPIIATRVLGSLIALLLSASPPVGLETRWDTSPACVEAHALPARVASLSGREAMPAARLSLGAERSGVQWKVSLELETPGSSSAAPLRRTLEGRDCATLTEAVALVVAVQLDAVAVAQVIASREAAPSLEQVELPEVLEVAEPSSPAPTRSPAPALRASDSDSAPSPSRRPRPRAIVGLAAAGELGILPRGAAAFELTGGLGWPRASLELGALTSLGPDGVSEQSPAVGGRFRLFTGLVRSCGVPSQGRLALPLCGGLELGDLRAVGTGLQRPSTVNAWWVAVVASARPQWWVSPRFGVGALLDLVVPLRRHRFAIAEAGPVHEVAPVAVRLGVHVSVRLP